MADVGYSAATVAVSSRPCTRRPSARRRPEVISDEQAELFRATGLLVVRDVLAAGELEALRREMLTLVEHAAARDHADPDYRYKRHELTGRLVPFRVEYVVEKSEAAKALLGHPFILRSVEKLQGRNFVPWDSMVFKLPGEGASIPWHRDGGVAQEARAAPIFNVDVYLDDADSSNCLWGIPGSNHWSAEQAQAEIARLSRDGFGVDRARPLPMRAGDVLFHDVLAIHGSARARSELRRVIYLEFRPVPTELTVGPHTPEYIPLKQRVLLACLRDRSRADYARGETPYLYRPDAEFAPPPLAPGERLATYRYPHEHYWREQ